VVLVEFFIGYSPPSSHLGPYSFAARRQTPHSRSSSERTSQRSRCLFNKCRLWCGCRLLRTVSEHGDGCRRCARRCGRRSWRRCGYRLQHADSWHDGRRGRCVGCSWCLCPVPLCFATRLRFTTWRASISSAASWRSGVASPPRVANSVSTAPAFGDAGVWPPIGGPYLALPCSGTGRREDVSAGRYRD
jgi:hypothetical protein